MNQKPLLIARRPIADGHRGLMLDYPMLEGDGTTLYDYAGNGIEGAFDSTNTPTWSPGAMGHAVTFARNDMVVVPNRDIIRPLAAWSISFWMKATDAESNFVCGQSDGTGTREWYLARSSANDLLFVIFGSVTVKVATSDLTEFAFGSDWAHICVTLDGSEDATNIKMYRDGALKTHNGTGAWGTLNDSGGPLWVGRYANATNDFAGELSNLKIANREWTQSEVVADYKDAFARYRHDEIALWSAATLGGAPPVGNAPTGHIYGPLVGCLGGPL